MRLYKLALLPLLLCCLLPAYAAATGEASVVIEGVGYAPGYMEGTLAIVSYPAGADVITVQTEIDGMPVEYDQSYLSSQDPSQKPLTAATLIFAEGGKVLPAVILSSWPEIERIVIPASVTELSNSFFDSQNATLAAFEVHADNPAFRAIDGLLYTRDGKTLIAFPCAKAGQYALPEGTESIARDAFRDDAYMRDTIPLTSLTLPASLTMLDVSALPHNEKLRVIEVAEGHPTYESREGMLYERETDTLLFVPAGQGSSLRVPTGTKRIASSAFRGGYWLNESLQSVSLPLTLEALEPYVFATCTSLTGVSLPLTLQSIPMGAFQECLALERIVLPPNIREIGALAFNGCTMLREVYIPDGVRYIDPSAFDYANEALVIYAGENTEGHAYARAHGLYWAAPGGTPARQEKSRPPVAVVNLPETGALASLQKLPATDGEPIAQYENGTLVEMLGQEGAWQRVRVGPVTGYLPADSLMPMDHLTSLIPLVSASLESDPMDGEDPDSWESEWPKLYTYPGLNAPRTLSYDNPEVDVIEAVGPWIYVDAYRQNMGYYPVHQTTLYREKTEDGKSYGIVANPEPSDRLHLRREPSRSAESLGRYFNGTQVELLGVEGDWARVRLDGKTGYMMREYVREVLVVEPMWGDPNG